MSTSVTVQQLHKHFHVRGSRTPIKAVNGVSFEIPAGTTLGLVGESGSGKSTVGRCLLRLLEPTSGSVHIGDTDLIELSTRDLRHKRSSMQMIFQDPYDSLNPRMTIGDLVEEPLLLHTQLGDAERRTRAEELLRLVRLDPQHLDRLPHQMSGGQLQRVGIARAIATEPDFLVLDEPTSSLDLSVRAGVLRLLKELQERLGMTYLLISHDLATVGAYCDRMAVMYLGAIVEIGSAAEIFQRPQHPYTQALLSADLPPDPRAAVGRHMLEGELPSPLDLPSGCLFSSRCPLVREDCLPAHPDHRVVDAAGLGHSVACVRVDDGTNLLSAPSRPAQDIA